MGLALDMPVRLVRANPRVRADVGCVAVSRGPIVYCLEESDNGRDLQMLRLDGATSADFNVEWRPDKLGGIVELTCQGARESDEAFGGALYSAEAEVRQAPCDLTFIPYYSWANREVGEMRVWVRER